jgi:hemolysin III
MTMQATADRGGGPMSTCSAEREELLPMTAVTMPSAVVEARPVWRGWLHTIAFFAAIPGTFVLVGHADHPSAKVAALVYGLGLMAGFGTSAAYHRLAHTPRARRIMQRMDHSMIFVLIAGTCTPMTTR